MALLLTGNGWNSHYSTLLYGQPHSATEEIRCCLHPLLCYLAAAQC
jgi:hypothetical protein